MPRTFRRRSGFRRRRRTRWLAIIPGTRGGLATNTFASDQLGFQDRDGTVPNSEMIGGTLLRLIFDIVIQYTIGTVDGGSAIYNGHFGLLVTPDNSLASAVWSPNSPSGNLMIREQAAMQTLANTAAAGGAVWHYDHNARLVHIDTKVKRRWVENDSLHAVWHHFLSGPNMTGVDYGWTGRALFALP